jgi:hypothetical protein
MTQHHHRPAEPRAGTSSTKAGWRPLEWAADAGISRAKTYQLLASGELKSVRLGSARIIVTSPAAYLASLADRAA